MSGGFEVLADVAYDNAAARQDAEDDALARAADAIDYRGWKGPMADREDGVPAEMWRACRQG